MSYYNAFLKRCLFLAKITDFVPKMPFYLTKIWNFVPKIPVFNTVPLLTEISKSTVKNGILAYIVYYIYTVYTIFHFYNKYYFYIQLAKKLRFSVLRPSMFLAPNVDSSARNSGKKISILYTLLTGQCPGLPLTPTNIIKYKL